MIRFDFYCYKKLQGVSWWSSGYDLAFSPPWPTFSPWSGNLDPTSFEVPPQKVAVSILVHLTLDPCASISVE